MTRVVWRFRPDLIVVKEMESELRGRSLGEVPRLITDELARLTYDNVIFCMEEVDLISKITCRRPTKADLRAIMRLKEGNS